MRVTHTRWLQRGNRRLALFLLGIALLPFLILAIAGARWQAYFVCAAPIALMALLLYLIGRIVLQPGHLPVHLELRKYGIRLVEDATGEFLALAYRDIEKIQESTFHDCLILTSQRPIAVRRGSSLRLIVDAGATTLQLNPTILAGRRAWVARVIQRRLQREAESRTRPDG
jgi:hypothetical protein